MLKKSKPKPLISGKVAVNCLILLLISARHFLRKFASKLIFNVKTHVQLIQQKNHKQTNKFSLKTTQMTSSFHVKSDFCFSSRVKINKLNLWEKKRNKITCYAPHSLETFSCCCWLKLEQDKRAKRNGSACIEIIASLGEGKKYF